MPARTQLLSRISLANPSRLLLPLVGAAVIYTVFSTAANTASAQTVSQCGEAVLVKSAAGPFHVRFYRLPQGGGRTTRKVKLDLQAPSIFIIHGFMDRAVTHDGTRTAGWMEKIARAIRTGKAVENGTTANIVLVDWSAGSGDSLADYFQVVTSVQPVGAAVAKFIADVGINPSRTMLIGHSLGGHIAGAAGAQIRLQGEGAKLQAIVGIDEAGPGFESVKASRMLDASDAVSVISLKTSAWCGRRKHCATTSLFINPVRDAAGKLLGFNHPGNAPTLRDFRKLNLAADRQSHLYGREVLVPALLQNERLQAGHQQLCFQSLLTEKSGVYDVVTTDPMH